MSRRKHRDSAKDAWAAWTKSQRKLLEAWGGGFAGAGMPVPPWGPGPAATGGFPSQGWPGLGPTPPWNAFATAPMDFYTAATRGMSGGAAAFAPQPKMGFELPGAAEMFHHIPGAWMQSLLGVWPVMGDALAQISEQVSSQSDGSPEAWHRALEGALSEGKKAFVEGERNVRTFASQLLSLGFPQLPEATSVDGAAARDMNRKWLEQWLSMPAMGPYRAEQESATELLRLSLDVQDKVHAHNELMAGMGERVIDAMRERLLVMLEEEKSLSSLRDGFNLWVECCERVYRERVMNERYSRCYGEMVNAFFRLRKGIMQRQQHWLETQGWPSQRELDAVLKQQHVLSKQCAGLVGKQQDLVAHLAELREQHDGTGTRLEALGQRLHAMEAHNSESQVERDADTDVREHTRQQAQRLHTLQEQCGHVDGRMDFLQQEQRHISEELAELGVRMSQALNALQASATGTASRASEDADCAPEVDAGAAVPQMHAVPADRETALKNAPAQDYWNGRRYD